uniref:CSON009160 protein n=1 Tax=Culicoides sonorensis TaxID=179676 RepID=A0A336LKV6_CULSO
MEDFAFDFLPKVKFLSLIRADITYLNEDKQFYFDKVVQPSFLCFGCSEARIVLELDHAIEFILKDDKIIHEPRPEGRIVGGKVFEFDNFKSLPAIEEVTETPSDDIAVESTPVIEEPVE